MDFDTVADELYALTPEEFTATRNERAKQAKSQGDRELAERIRGLSKPTAAAWLVNQLVRERRDEIQPLLELGAGLREATANLSGDDLRRLSQQQHQLVYALVQQARGIADALEHKVSDDTARGVEETLRAALANDDAAEQMAAGRLTDVLTHVGFGTDTSPRARPTATKRKAPAEAGARSKDEERAAQLERARQDVAAARQTLDDARRELDQAAQGLARVDKRAQQLDEQVQRLREELDAAQRQQADVDRDRRRRVREQDRADREVREAEGRLHDATEREQRIAADSG